MPRLRRCGAALLVLAIGAACTDPTDTRYGPDGPSAYGADALRHVADSLSHARADGAVVSGYYALSNFVYNVGRATPVTISIDGVAEEYLASVRQTDPSPGGCLPDVACVPSPGLRTLVAWRRSDVRRVVQLTIPSAQGSFGTSDVVGFGSRFLATATLTFLDGTGGYLAGTSGTGSIDMTSKTTEPCIRYAPLPPGALSSTALLTSSAGPQLACTQAEYSVAFTGTLQPPPAGDPNGNTASGSHTIAMGAHPVPGGLDFRGPCWECTLPGYPNFTLPPVDLQPTRLLPATLAVAVTDVVTLTFTVTNNTSTPAPLRFASAQQYDFNVANPATRSIVWRWSADRVFAQLLTARTLAPGEQLVITERWTPTVKGNLYASAHLMSTSHSAFALYPFVVP